MGRNWSRSLRLSAFRRGACLRLDRLEDRETPAAFMPGNLAIYRIGDGTTAPANAGTPVFIDEYTPTGTLVQSIALPATAAQSPTGPYLISTASVAEGAMQLSPDGKYLALPGYSAAIPTGGGSLSSATSASINRAVAIVDSTGAYRISTFSDLHSGQQIRSAVTLDGYSGYTVGGNTGVRYFAKATDTTTSEISTTITNNNTIAIVAGQLFTTNGSANPIRLGTVGTGVPTTSGQTVTNLPGFATTGGARGFFFADLSPTVSFNGLGLDTLYFADDALPTPGIQKWSFDGANWNKLGTLSLLGARSLTGSVSGSTVTLFAGTGSSSTNINTLVKVEDTAGFGADNNGVVVNLATSPGNSQFRGIMLAPINSQLPTPLNSLSASTTTTSGPAITYTATFGDPVTTLNASNFSLEFTGSATATIGTPTGSGTSWTIPITGISGGGTLQLKMANSTGTAPPIVQFADVTGTLVTVTPAAATLDVDGSGKAIFAAKSGTSNSVTVSLAAGTYSIEDPADVIILTPNAISKGWSGSGTNKVSGPDANTSALSLNLGDGTDSFTLLGAADPLEVQTAAGAVGSVATFPVSVNFGARLSVSGFDVISSAGGVLLSANSVTLNGGTIGSAMTPISIAAADVVAAAGAGGMHLLEEDGATFILSATGSGSISVFNKADALIIENPGTFAAGNVSLTSNGDVIINAPLGDAGSTGAVAIVANADGIGAEGFSMSTIGLVTTGSTASPAFSLTVNTLSGGSGDAVVGNIIVGATGKILIDANQGSILSAGGTTSLQAGGGALAFPGSVELKSSGAFSSIGSLTTRVAVRTGTISAQAGGGGLYLSENSTQDAQVLLATATGAGDVDLFTTSGANNGLVIVGTVAAQSGNITIRSDDQLRVESTGLIGGAMFSGRILINANFDGLGNEDFSLAPTVAVTVQTTSTAIDAVVINVSGGTDTAGFAGATLGNIKVADGGGITVTAGAAIGSPITDPFRAGFIAMNHDGSASPLPRLDAGPTGTVTLTARDNPIGVAGVPVLVTAGTVVAKTNSTLDNFNPSQADGDIFVRSTGPASFSGSTTSAKNMTLDRRGDIDFSTAVGDLTINGDVSVTTGNIALAAAGNVVQTNGGIVTTGDLSFNPAGGTAILATAFNSAGTMTIAAGQRLLVDGAITMLNPVIVNGTLGGIGTVIGDVSVISGGAIAPGASPGLLTASSTTLAAGAKFEVELNGLTPGVDHDQLVVNGDLTLTGAILTGSLGFSPTVGQAFTIIDNTGINPVVGTFAGIAEGGTVAIGSKVFQVSYVGGDGNDVTLTTTAAAPPAAKVTGVVINDGAAQRSRVTTIRVNFDQPVTLASPATAFTLNRVTPSAASVTLNVALGGGGTFATLTFVGGAVDGAPGKLSLADGRYTLTAVASQFGGTGLDGNSDGTAGDDFVLLSTPFGTPTPTSPATGIFRLAGDGTGNGKVESDDFLAFRLAFLTPSDTFDFDGINGVDSADFLRFRINFLAQIV